MPFGDFEARAVGASAEQLRAGVAAEQALARTVIDVLVQREDFLPTVAELGNSPKPFLFEFVSLHTPFDDHGTPSIRLHRNRHRTPRPAQTASAKAQRQLRSGARPSLVQPRQRLLAQSRAWYPRLERMQQ